MRVYCCQFDIVWEDKPANYARVRSLLGAARMPAGSLVVLPEMFATGFSMNVAGIAEPDDGATARFLSTAARELGVHIVGGLVAPGQHGRGLNQAVAFDPSGVHAARYTKQYPFTPGGESLHYARGADCVSFAWGGFTVAPLICYDLRFPEAFRRSTMRGVQFFTVIANWPVARESHWVTLLQARAIENQAYVAAVNRCGADPKFRYPGRSMIINPHGEVLADAGAGEGVIGADVDLEALLKWRRDFPVLEDMV
jgi:predicted amidohydrolase